MRLRMKILSGFLILTLMLAIAGVWSIYELRFVGRSAQAMLDENYKSIDAGREMTEALEREDSGLLLLLSGKWEKGRSIIQSADKSFLKKLEVVQHNVTIPGEKDYIKRVQNQYAAYKDLLMKPIVGTRYEGDLTWYFEKAHKAFLELKGTIQKLVMLNDQFMYRSASDLKNRAYRSTMPGIVAILSALVFALIFNYFINYYIVGPVIRITKGIQRVLETREPLDVSIETRDELAELAGSIRQLAARAGHGERTP